MLLCLLNTNKNSKPIYKHIQLLIIKFVVDNRNNINTIGTYILVNNLT